MLPVQYRMTRSADFGATVKQGRRAVQPDVIVYSRVVDDRPGDTTTATAGETPRVGLIIAKSVGSAVGRHRVARRLRHVAREVVDDLQPAERLVIRALPSSSGASSAALRTQLRAALRSVHRVGGGSR